MSAALQLVPPPAKPARRAPRKPKGDVMLTRQQVAELLGFVEAHATDRLLKKHADFPKPDYAFSRSPRWLRSQVMSWLKKRARAAQGRTVEMERA